MHLRILLPFEVFLEVDDVTKLVAETPGGAFGMLPHRLDCVTPLSAGIFSYTAGSRECFLALDQGILVKTGPEVVVSVRQALAGADLGQLRRAVEEDFVKLNEQEKTARSLMAKLESGLIQRFVEFHA
jgi:F-type H+-transporting ATPase subunit epsilon